MKPKEITSGKVVPMKLPEGKNLQQLLRPPEKRAFADTRRSVEPQLDAAENLQ